MSNAKTKRLATALAVAGAAALLVGCGSGNNSTVPPVAGIPGYGTGIPGVPGISGGCVPINANAPIPFTGNNIFMNSSSIMAGFLPDSGQTYGVVGIGGGAGNGQFQATGYDGTLSLNVLNFPGMGAYPMPGAYPGAPYAPGIPGAPYAPGVPGLPGMGNVSITGLLTLSPTVIQDIYMSSGYGYGYGAPGMPMPGMPMPGMPGAYPGYPAPGMPGAYPGYPGMPGVPGMPYGAPQVCASNVALNVGYAMQSGMGYYRLFGIVYLYLNGTNRGVKLWF